jgi:hypothetical protein
MDIIPKLFVGRALFIRFCRELHGLSFGKKIKYTRVDDF